METIKKRILTGKNLFVDRITGPKITVFNTEGVEFLLYPLTGSAFVDITSRENKSFPVTVRNKIFQPKFWEPGNHCAIRVPGIHHYTVRIEPVQGECVDWLLFLYIVKPTVDAVRPVACGFEGLEKIGENTYRRAVRHLKKPNGFRIDAGETRNKPGQWSSWPSHASSDDIELFRQGKSTWEEAFFCITAPVVPTIPDNEVFALMSRNGVIGGSTWIGKCDDAIKVYNGQAFFTPLGSHPIVSSPVTNLFYVWAYAGTALEKSYNRVATDTGTYVK